MSENMGMLISSWVTSGLTALLLLIAWWQLTSLRKEAERERRPYVSVELVRGETGKGLAGLYLVFANTGKTPARGVTARFSTKEWKAIGNRRLPFESDPGILLVPGSQLTFFIGPDSSPLSDLYATAEGVCVSVQYHAGDSSRTYEDSFPLSLLNSYGAKRRVSS